MADIKSLDAGEKVEVEKNKDKIGCFLEKYEKYIKGAALGIAILLMFSILTDADKVFTNFKILRSCMLTFYWVIVLTSYYLGGVPTALKSAAIAGLIFFLIFVFIQKTPEQIANKAGELLNSSASSTISDTIVLDSGIYNFRLDPGQTNDKWMTIQEGCRYSFSSSTANDPISKWFFLVYKDGKMIKVDRADTIIPPGPGPFKLMGGENGAYIKLLIVKKT
jgi:hypothetical protein